MPPSALPASRIGVDPLDRVFAFENHDRAYQLWSQEGFKKRNLVHVDAHHDMWWIKEGAPRTIANFICSALREGIVTDVWWIVPDQALEGRAARRHVLRHVEKIRSKYARSGGVSQREDGAIQIPIEDGKLCITTLRGLPKFGEPVLLDLDTDFMVIPRVTYGRFDTHSPLPWIWPEELLRKLAESGLQSDFVTIAYSVEGGYTPLKWKYLGDELAIRIRAEARDGRILQAMEAVKSGSQSAQGGDSVAAEAGFHRAISLEPAWAPAHLHLALLHLRMSRDTEARDSYQTALSLDPSFRTPYNNAGLLRLAEGDLSGAESELRGMLKLDSRDPYAHYGLGSVARRRKDWRAAETSLREALAIDGDLLDALRELGKVLARLGQTDAAVEAYERSLKVALGGRGSLLSAILTCSGPMEINDPEHCRVYAELSRLYRKQGRSQDALDSCRIALAGNPGDFRLRFLLSRLYRETGMRKKAWKELGRAIWSMLGGRAQRRSI